MKIKLNNWSFCSFEDDFKIPGSKQVRLQGTAIEHPNLGINKQIISSVIIKANGRIITTRSGSIYQLGTVNPKFKKWIKQELPNWDWKNPLL